jgi:hypothetical protein
MTQLANISQVKTLTVTRRVRALARSGQVLLPVGREVAPTHVVARGPSASAYHVMRASEALKVAPEKLDDYLLVGEGAEVERGTPLLRKPAAFGRTKTYRSPADGTVALVRDGNLILLRKDKSEEIRAMVRGKVVSIIPDRGVVIEVVGSLVQAAWDSGKDAFGRLHVAVGNASERLTVEGVGLEAGGAVFIAGFVDNKAVLESLEERGVKGLVAGSMPSELCLMAKALSYPVLLTEGVGRRPMADPIFELLRRSEGHEVSLLTQSHLNRPQPAEILIALSTSGAVPQAEASDPPLQTGSLVRVLGMDDNTAFGRVKKLYAQPRWTPHGGMASGADVVLDNGSSLFVPYANLDLIG